MMRDEDEMTRMRTSESDDNNYNDDDNNKDDNNKGAGRVRGTRTKDKNDEGQG